MLEKKKKKRWKLKSVLKNEHLKNHLHDIGIQSIVRTHAMGFTLHVTRRDLSNIRNEHLLGGQSIQKSLYLDNEGLSYAVLAHRDPLPTNGREDCSPVHSHKISKCCFFDTIKRRERMAPRSSLRETARNIHDHEGISTDLHAP